MNRLSLLVLLIFQLNASALRADHDQLALRLFLGCLDEFDASFADHSPSRYSEEKDQHQHALDSLSQHGIYACSTMIGAVCEAGAEDVAVLCMNDVATAIGEISRKVTAGLPATIDAASKFETEFYQRTLSNARAAEEESDGNARYEAAFDRAVEATLQLAQARLAVQLHAEYKKGSGE